MNNNELITLVQDAIADFLKENPSLLNLNVHEQSISHRIAVYIERHLNSDELNVDCEYNKNLGEPKLIEVEGFDRNERMLCGCPVCANTADKVERERRFRPDIIVHRRNSNEQNILAMEIKKDKFCPFDEAKIIALTGSRLDYSYQLGVFVYFPQNEPIFRWYSKGQRIVI